MPYTASEGIADALALFDIVKSAAARNYEVRTVMAAKGADDAVDTELQVAGEFFPKLVELVRLIRKHAKD